MYKIQRAFSLNLDVVQRLDTLATAYMTQVQMASKPPIEPDYKTIYDILEVERPDLRLPTLDCVNKAIDRCIRYKPMQQVQRAVDLLNEFHAAAKRKSGAGLSNIGRGRPSVLSALVEELLTIGMDVYGERLQAQAIEPTVPKRSTSSHAAKTKAKSAKSSQRSKTKANSAHRGPQSSRKSSMGRLQDSVLHANG